MLEQRVGLGIPHELLVDLIGPERLGTHSVLRFLAHRDPCVGEHAVRAGHGLERIGRHEDRSTGRGGDRLGVLHDRLIGQIAIRAGHGHMHAGHGAREQVRVRHVVRRIAQVRDRHAFERVDAALELGQGQEVGEHLTGVEFVGERVDDRHCGHRSHLLDA